MTNSVLSMPMKTIEPYPEMDCGHDPVGCWIVVQHKLVPAKTAGGIIRPDVVRDADQVIMTTAKVVAVGPLAFRDQVTGAEFPGAPWFKVGDLVRVPAYGGDKFFVEHEGEKVHFSLIKDEHVRAIVRKE